MATSVRRKRPPIMGKDLSVMAWIEDVYGRVLFVKQAQGRKLWALPGGKVRRNEALGSALCREVTEETGLRVTHYAPVDYFDRYKKGSLTILYRVRVHGRASKLTKPVKLSPRISTEISAVEYKTGLPRACTPSAGHFYRRNFQHPSLIATSR